ncbi:hypothetical protein [Zavarzinia sp.]|uniref:hypothetical protein n=1 Tax=Zavarzinia sp. TaxID=2027920 RepID=UPI00356A11DC
MATAPHDPGLPPRRRRGGAQGILWGLVGAFVAALAVGGLFWLDQHGGPGPGLSVAGHLSPPTPAVPAPAPAPAAPPPAASPAPATLPGSAALLPEGGALSPAPAPALAAPALATPAPAAPAPQVPEAPAALAPQVPPPGRTPAPSATLEQIVTRLPDHLTTYRAAHNPRVLVLDFPSFHAQAMALNRIAALIEKKGAPRDRVMSDAELRRAIADSGKSFDTYYGGHDYDSAALARFFTLAENVGVTVAEGEVLEILLKQKVIRVADQGFTPGEPAQALVTLASVGGDDAGNIALRREVLRHEFAHGEFFTQVFFRSACDDFWRKGLNDAERKLFTRFLERAGYDVKNETLVINEMQAYLGFTLAPELFGPRQLGIDDKAFAALRERFRKAVPAAIDF